MRKMLTKTGNSLAPVLDRPLLERANIDADTPLDVTTGGHVIVMSPVRSTRRTTRLAKIMEEAHRRSGRPFKRLAE